jgi:hypothetical protein
VDNLPNIVMYARTTCGLCDEARAVILAERTRGSAFEFREVLIDGDESLELRYGLRVPVVEVNGREEFEFQVHPARLRELLSDRL